MNSRVRSIVKAQPFPLAALALTLKRRRGEKMESPTPMRVSVGAAAVGLVALAIASPGVAAPPLQGVCSSHQGHG